MSGDEVVIVERMHERALDAGHRTLLQGLPGDRVRNEDQTRAEGSHPFNLGGRRGLDRDDRAANARLTRRIGNALPGIARTDGPDAAPALRLRQHRNRVGGTAQLVGVDRLQILQLQPDVGVAAAQFEAHQRRAQNGRGDSLARSADLGQFNRADGSRARDKFSSSRSRRFNH